LFHNRDCQDADIVRLRELHGAMDRAILACYGWPDLEAGHDFHANVRGQLRYTVSPGASRLILRRLLDLNLALAGEEAAQREGRRPVERVAVTPPPASPVTLLPPAAAERPAAAASAATGQADVPTEPVPPPRSRESARVTGPDRYRQAAVLAWLAARGQADQNFGRVKLVKELYFIQEHLGLDLKLDFIREAAGPLDPKIYEVEGLARKFGWLEVSGARGDWAHYRSGKTTTVAATTAREAMADRLADVNSLLATFQSFSTLKMEQWATVHQVWRERRDAEQALNRDAIASAVLAWKPNRNGFDIRSVGGIVDEMVRAGFISTSE